MVWPARPRLVCGTIVSIHCCDVEAGDAHLPVVKPHAHE
jgi:hypothetical protein